MSNKKLLLISMPWANFHIPSIQLGVLAAYLKEQGIEVECKNYYLKMAEFLGIPLYNQLASFSPEAPVLYSELLFPNKEKSYRNFMTEVYDPFTASQINPDELVAKFKEFQQNILDELSLDSYDIIGFTLGYHQEVPSLCLAREIKARAPEKKIIFGGPSCYEEMGEFFISNFPYVDIVVRGEGEKTLTELVDAIRKGESLDHILGISYRREGRMRKNPPRPLIEDLNQLPVPIFDAYFQEYAQCQTISQKPFYHTVSLPIEGSRGCWWNQCAFCSLNSQFSDQTKKRHFRSKDPERIVQEMVDQRKRYRVGTFSFLDNVHFKMEKFSEKLINEIGDFNYFKECRAEITPKALGLMKESGCTEVQIGVESLSDGILRKMKKGTTVMQNVNALKWCKFFGIRPTYNIIIQFPNETVGEVQEVFKTAQKIVHLDPPAALTPFRLEYNSPIYHQQEEYNVATIEPHLYYQYVYPADIYKKMTVTYFDYIPKSPRGTDKLWKDFRGLVDLWKNEKVKSLAYYDYDDHLKIVDQRYAQQVVGILESRERQIYLFCNLIRSRKEIHAHLKELENQFIDSTLSTLVQYGVMIQEEDRFLSLALPGGVKGRRKLEAEIMQTKC